MPQDIEINGFIGMNNISPSFLVKKGVVMPRVLLNADTDAAGKLNIRDGFSLYLSLAGAHSLFASEFCMLCSAGGYLYDISTGQAVQVSAISGLNTEPLSYSLIDGLVYISNKFWTGVFYPETRTVTGWGISIPNQPILIQTSGNLQPGTYHVTITNVVNNEISGNGQISSITLLEEGGIQVLNRPVGSLVWATDQDGYSFTLVGNVDNIVEIPTIEPLPSFMCAPPPGMSHIIYALGRVWGSVDNVLYYSEPYHTGWFKINSNRFQFDSEITMLAHVSTGMFVGMIDKTIFLNGTEPGQMTQINAGAGSIRGTLAYCNNLPEMGDILGTPEKGFVDVPVWRTTEGIVAGNVTGKLYNLTKHKVKMGTPQFGASLYRQKNGEFQFITSADTGSAGSGIGGYDTKLREAVKAGKLAMNNFSKIINTSVASLSEDVSCELRRGGVVIP